MGIGIESGSNRILKIIGKNYGANTALTQLNRLMKVGILPTVSIMIGQYTETEEDVEASISFMKTSVRDNPNIAYAFTVTTPFPGSQLYNILFEKHYIETHKEFYDKYFTKGEFGCWNQVVNMSDMTDEKVSKMFNKINEEYKFEKNKLKTQRKAAKVELFQRIISKGHRIIYIKFLNKFSNNKIIKFIPKVYNIIYEYTQIQLDKLRIKLRNL